MRPILFVVKVTYTYPVSEPTTQSQKISKHCGWSLLEYFPSDNLVEIKVKERQIKSLHILANTQSVIILDYFVKLPIHSEYLSTQNTALAQSARLLALDKLLPLAACALSLYLVVGPNWNADDLPRDAATVPTIVKGSRIVADYLTQRC